MTAGLSGSVPAVLDLYLLRPGDQLDVLLDGWRGETLRLRVLQVRPFLAHWLDRAWVCGIDQSTLRLREVLVRAELPIPAQPADLSGAFGRTVR